MVSFSHLVGGRGLSVYKQLRNVSQTYLYLWDSWEPLWLMPSVTAALLSACPVFVSVFCVSQSCWACCSLHVGEHRQVAVYFQSPFFQWAISRGYQEVGCWEGHYVGLLSFIHHPYCILLSSKTQFSKFILIFLCLDLELAVLPKNVGSFIYIIYIYILCVCIFIYIIHIYIWKNEFTLIPPVSFPYYRVHSIFLFPNL